MVYAELLFPTSIPILISGFFALLEQYFDFSKIKPIYRQICIGVVFGIYTIYSTEFGITISDGAILNVRDAGPLCAGFIFGGWAGVISGIIGGVYRYFSIYWGSVEYTAIACSLATIIAGLSSALIRKVLFEDKIVSPLAGLGFGATMEVLHMLLILLTNLKNVKQAFVFVQACTNPMAFCNSIAVFGSIALYRFLFSEKFYYDKRHHLNQVIAIRLLIVVVVAYILSSWFTYQIIYRITSHQHELLRNVTLYINSFIEVLIFTTMFIVVYEVIKKKIVKNITEVNKGLTKITNGELDTKIEVKKYAEFEELSNHINSTVDTLKKYSEEIQNKVNQELEFASKIQYSLLPHHFPKRDDFKIYASMKAAKVVGGDFYDFFMADPFTLVFVIADASGKGVPASMFTMTTKTMLRDYCERNQNIGEVLTRTNNKLCANNDAEMFVTAWLGKLDLRSGKLEFCNAGHNAPVLIKDGKAEFLKAKPNFVLGGIPELQYQKQEIMIKPGDMLYLYTDGVTEATADVDGEKVLFGDDRLIQVCDELNDQEPKEFIKSMAVKIETFEGDEPQSDDITMLAIRFTKLVDAAELIRSFNIEENEKGSE